MNVFAKFDEIPSMILQDIKETKRYGRTVGRTTCKQYTLPQTQFAAGITKALISEADLRLYFRICKMLDFS